MQRYTSRAENSTVYSWDVASTNPGVLDLENVTGEVVHSHPQPLAAERAIEITSRLIDLARIENKVPPTVPKQKICFDEWNVWDPFRALGEEGAGEKYTLSDALAAAVWLNVFIRQAQHIGMANIAQSINVVSPLMTHQAGLTEYR
ncbi:hypothetical protein B0T25DRAFT_548390 [Lasiosphaeria hispida]|uniref:Alpha-L-arabinofuranosidase C-terminal domain-containing protein n=1 Tax=Lasiosphaeria hispida TaxID=260671 RepID=A0AAJ0HFB1_9PEZI|nr:hypothetical protein B0T25DRAFT_548390 [Lasiosphaeria hispida]